MTAAHLIACAWLATMIVTVAVAARQGIPILQAFAPIRTYPGLYVPLALSAIACLFASLQFLSDVRPLGQQPITLASLFAPIYCWATIAHQMRKA